jgi:hypothetical protein
MPDRVEAELTLRIPRDSERSLHEEARDRLAETGVVERVDDFDVTGVRPRLNDLQVRANASIACESTAEPREALAEAVGIEAVDSLDHDHDHEPTQ